MNILTSSDICRETGVDYSKLVYAERRGYIPKAKRTNTNQRFYTENDLQELKRLFNGIGRNKVNTQKDTQTS